MCINLLTEFTSYFVYEGAFCSTNRAICDGCDFCVEKCAVVTIPHDGNNCVR